MEITIRKRLLIYASIFSVVFAAWLLAPAILRPKIYSVPSDKVARYLARRTAYNIVFIGDSRTFTDIQPRVIDLLIGRRSYNLATFGLWMPVQYLEFRDVFPEVPSGTVLVWSLSHQNFAPVGERWWIPGQYAFGFFDFLEYAMDGYPVKRILQEYEESPYSPADLAVKAKKRLILPFQAIVWRSGHPISRQEAAQPTVPANGMLRPEASQPVLQRAESNRAAAARIINQMKNNDQVVYVSPVVKDGVVNSVETTRVDGGYDRIIVDRDFFKAEQSQLWPVHSGSDDGCHFTANDVYMRTFVKILNLISEYHLRVIVNYIEDAPGSWPSDSERSCAKRFMIQTIVPILRQRGIGFVAPDLYPKINYSNDYYFDNSHLHSEGAGIYSSLLAPELKKVLDTKGW